MLAADTCLQVWSGLSTSFNTDFHKFANSILI